LGRLKYIVRRVETCRLEQSDAQCGAVVDVTVYGAVVEVAVGGAVVDVIVGGAVVVHVDGIALWHIRIGVAGR
jgi:hypothetical protein